MKAILWCGMMTALLGLATAQEAQQILWKAIQQPQNLNSMKIRGRGFLQMEGVAPNGKRIDFKGDIEVHLAYVRPNKVAMRFRWSDLQYEAYSDGHTFSFYLPRLKQYARSQDAQVVQAFGNQMLQQVKGPAPQLLQRIEALPLKLVGVKQVQGREMFVLAMDEKEAKNGFQGKVALALYIGKSDYLLRGMEMGFQFPGASSAESKNGSLQARMKMWLDYDQINGPISERTFVFKPPSGAKKVELATLWGQTQKQLLRSLGLFQP